MLLDLVWLESLRVSFGTAIRRPTTRIRYFDTNCTIFAVEISLSISQYKTSTMGCELHKDANTAKCIKDLSLRLLKASGSLFSFNKEHLQLFST